MILPEKRILILLCWFWNSVLNKAFKIVSGNKFIQVLKKKSIIWKEMYVFSLNCPTKVF